MWLLITFIQPFIEIGIKDLTHECLEISNELGLQNVMNGNTTKGFIKKNNCQKDKRRVVE